MPKYKVRQRFTHIGVVYSPDGPNKVFDTDADETLPEVQEGLDRAAVDYIRARFIEDTPIADPPGSDAPEETEAPKRRPKRSTKR